MGFVPLRPDRIADAAAAQQAAAVDPSPHVRVVAGPGTGKSATIEARVCWLLDEGVPPEAILAISFTRAAARDLQVRITKAREGAGLAGGEAIAVSTLHSLALRTLRRAGALAAYPAEPVVLQQWELRNIYDAEFGKTVGIGSITRREEIRRDHEAFWCTGNFNPPNVVPPDPPISTDERARFNAFHRPRTQLYSCVLPGEVVARCVEMMDAGTLDPVSLLGISELIIDEFQDLNPMDLRFVHGAAERGARLFVAGDDDQSLYAFRFATPEGIERFTQERPDSGEHTLSHCFRCSTRVLDAAQTLIRTFPADGRIEKNLVSLWDEADPPIPGGRGCWTFSSGAAEATAIASSCRALINAGMAPQQIMILLASTRTQAREIGDALQAAGVPHSSPREGSTTDSEAGRAGYAVLSIVVDPQNYVAHRTLLGIRRGVGLGTCNEIARGVIANDRNFRELFYGPVPDGLVTGRAKSAITSAADVCAELAGWNKEDQLSDRLDDVSRLVCDIRADDEAADDLRDFLTQLPESMTLEEAQAYLSADRDVDRLRVLTTHASRIGAEEPDTSLVPDRVQVLTMHGAKGLSAQVVFVPGLEDDILPGTKRKPYPGLVLEAARMLYVSITRARLACILSFARTRFVNGQTSVMAPSRFTSALGKQFEARTGGVTPELAAKAVALSEQMQ